MIKVMHVIRHSVQAFPKPICFEESLRNGFCPSFFLLPFPTRTCVACERTMPPMNAETSPPSARSACNGLRKLQRRTSPDLPFFFFSQQRLAGRPSRGLGAYVITSTPPTRVWTKRRTILLQSGLFLFFSLPRWRIHKEIVPTP